MHHRLWSSVRQVAAVSLGARLDCDQFANAHSSTSHYDRQSFVGLAWRPVGEPICCGARLPPRSRARAPFDRRARTCAEIYSTGRANLPGSTRQRELLRAWSRMAGQLLKHSDQPHLADLLAPELRDAHEPSAAARDDAPLAARGDPPLTAPPERRAKSKPRAGGKRKADAALDDLPPLAATSLWDAEALKDEGVSPFEHADGDDDLLEGFM